MLILVMTASRWLCNFSHCYRWEGERPCLLVIAPLTRVAICGTAILGIMLRIRINIYTCLTGKSNRKIRQRCLPAVRAFATVDADWILDRLQRSGFNVRTQDTEGKTKVAFMSGVVGDFPCRGVAHRRSIMQDKGPMNNATYTEYFKHMFDRQVNQGLT